MTSAACGVARTRSTPTWSARSTSTVAPDATASCRAAARFARSLPPTWNEPSAPTTPSSTMMWPMAASLASVLEGCCAIERPSRSDAATTATRSRGKGCAGSGAACNTEDMGLVILHDSDVGGRAWGVARANGVVGGMRYATHSSPSVVVGTLRPCFVQIAADSVEPAGALALRRIAVSAMRERFADVLAHVAVRRERIVLTRHGREVGAIVPVEDLRRLREMDGADADQENSTIAAHRAS